MPRMSGTLECCMKDRSAPQKSSTCRSRLLVCRASLSRGAARPPSRSRSPRIAKTVEEAGLRERRLLVDDAAVTLGDQQTLNVADLLARAVVNLDHDLLNSRPVVFVDTSQDVQLAFFRVDLEQIDRREVVVPDDVRHRGRPALVGLAAEPVRGEFADIAVDLFRPRSTRRLFNMLRTTA